MLKHKFALAFAALAALSACGDTIGEQAVGGAAIGAGAAVITNDSLAKGAAVMKLLKFYLNNE